MPISLDVRFRKGSTLIEFLVVLGLLAITIGASLLFLTSILRGSNQTTVVNEVKQNGQVLLDSLERQIRGAKSASNMTSNLPGPLAISGVSLSLVDGNTFYLVCFRSNPPSANGYIASATRPTGGATPSLTDYKTLTNQDVVTGVDISSCSLNAPAPVSSINAGIVVISFTMNQGVRAPSRIDFLANSQFSTTISLRKY